MPVRDLDLFAAPAAERALRAVGPAHVHHIYLEDFVADRGIINLLRTRYVGGADLPTVFRFYQETRRDPTDDHYECLVATLVLALAGSVVAGVLLRLAKSGPPPRLSLPALGPAIDAAQRLRDFGDEEGRKVERDLERLARAHAARSMLQTGIISPKEYRVLSSTCLVAGEDDTTRLGGLDERYLQNAEAIDARRLALATKAYARGAVLKILDDEPGLRLPSGLDQGPKESWVGTSASVGLANADGIELDPKFGPRAARGKVLMLVDEMSSDDLLPWVQVAAAVIVFGGGKTGHAAVICRGMGKPCVLLDKSESEEVPVGAPLLVDGYSGCVRLCRVGGLYGVGDWSGG